MVGLGIELDGRNGLLFQGVCCGFLPCLWIWGPGCIAHQVWLNGLLLLFVGVECIGSGVEAVGLAIDWSESCGSVVADEPHG